MKRKPITPPRAKQFTFYPDVISQAYLESLDPGIRSKTINQALHAWAENEPGTELARLSIWLHHQAPRGQFTTGLRGLLDLYLREEFQFTAGGEQA